MCVDGSLKQSRSGHSHRHKYNRCKVCKNEEEEWQTNKEQERQTMLVAQ